MPTINLSSTPVKVPIKVYLVRCPIGASGHSAKALQLQFSDDGGSTSHDTYTEGDLWIRFSTNGGNTWTSWIQFASNILHVGISDPTSETGINGDLYINTSSWHIFEKADDTWSDLGTIEAPEIEIQYSSDGSSFHDIPVLEDIYMHISTDGGVTWGDPLLVNNGIVGPGSSVDSDLVLWSGTDGKFLKDGGPLRTRLGYEIMATGLISTITSPSDTHMFFLGNTESSVPRKITYFNLKMTLKNYFDTLYQAAGTYLSSLADDTSPELSGALDCNNEAIYWSIYTITGTTPAINVTNGNKQKWTLTGNSTPTITAFPGPTSIMLYIYQDASTAYTVTWPTIRWANDEAPDLTTLSGTVVVCLSSDGTNLFGSWAEYL